MKSKRTKIPDWIWLNHRLHRHDWMPEYYENERGTVIQSCTCGATVVIPPHTTATSARLP